MVQQQTADRWLEDAVRRLAAEAPVVEQEPKVTEAGAPRALWRVDRTVQRRELEGLHHEEVLHDEADGVGVGDRSDVEARSAAGWSRGCRGDGRPAGRRGRSAGGSRPPSGAGWRRPGTVTSISSPGSSTPQRRLALRMRGHGPCTCGGHRGGQVLVRWSRQSDDPGDTGLQHFEQTPIGARVTRPRG